MAHGTIGLGVKRCGDVVAAGVGLVLVSPVIALIALAIWLIEGPPVLFRQSRLGRWGRIFHILKFRTMRQQDGPTISRSGDPRITRLGRWLRTSKLDELPQLWNVFIGEMSLVGPRPEVPSYRSVWASAFYAIQDLRPGVTDLGSIAFADENEILEAHPDHALFYEHVLLRRKLALARWYRRHWSLGLDGRILIATAGRLVGWRGLVAAMLGPTFLSRARRAVAEGL